MTQAYGEAWYWDKRYAKESTGTFDWYQKYESLAPLLHLYVPPTTAHRRILVVGCGNSSFSEGMSNDGYTKIVNIDISSVVIEAMQKKYSDSPHLKYIEMDVTHMKAFEDGSFDAVIDKGTLDSLLCGHNSKTNAAKMLDEVERVLKNGGVYILITYGIPAYRLRLLRESHSWAIKLHVIDKLLPGECSKWELTCPVPLNSDGSFRESGPLENMDVHYIYVCTKEITLELLYVQKDVNALRILILENSPRKLAESCPNTRHDKTGQAFEGYFYDKDEEGIYAFCTDKETWVQFLSN